MTPEHLHNALRYAGILFGAESATFDAAGPEHRRRCEVALSELGELANAQERANELEGELYELESDYEAKQRELKDAEHELEEEQAALREAKRTINQLEDFIADNSAKAASAATGTP